MNTRVAKRQSPISKRRTTNGMKWQEALVGDARTYDGKRFHPPAPIMAHIHAALAALDKARSKSRKRASKR